VKNIIPAKNKERTLFFIEKPFCQWAYENAVVQIKSSINYAINYLALYYRQKLLLAQYEITNFFACFESDFQRGERRVKFIFL
jgi:hypothetical protein